MKKSLRKSALTLAIIASFGLTGCLNSNSDPSPETLSLNKTTTGVITGFGSVFINGVEYETKTAEVNIDGVPNAPGSDPDAGLKLGMVVTLSGDASGANGNAVSIDFNDELEGMVTEVPVTDLAGVTTGALKILGTTIHTDEYTIFESKVAGVSTIDQIELGHIIEVSGHSSGDGTVWATRLELKKIELEAGDEVELKGLVSGLADTTFSIGDMVISYTIDVLDTDIGTFANGMLVEVKSDGVVDGILVAKKIELKSQDKKSVSHDGDDDEVEVEGVVTSAALNNAFDVNGSTVTYDTATRFVHGSATTITLGIKIKVKGAIDANGGFIAQTIVFKPTGDLKMAGPVTSADAINNTVSMFGLTVHLENSTSVEDDRDDGINAKVKYLFGADDILAGDWLKIKAYKNSNGELVATKMKRKTLEADKLSKLEGKVDSIDASDSSLIVLSGVSVDLSGTGITAVLNDILELKGSYAGTLFTASEGEVGEADEHYIGGEDGEEHEADEADEKKETPEDNDHAAISPNKSNSIG